MEPEDVPDLLSVTSAEAKDRKRFARVAAEYRRQARKLKAEPRRA